MYSYKVLVSPGKVINFLFTSRIFTLIIYSFYLNCSESGLSRIIVYTFLYISTQIGLIFFLGSNTLLRAHSLPLLNCSRARLIQFNLLSLISLSFGSTSSGVFSGLYYAAFSSALAKGSRPKVFIIAIFLLKE